MADLGVPQVQQSTAGRSSGSIRETSELASGIAATSKIASNVRNESVVLNLNKDVHEAIDNTAPADLAEPTLPTPTGGPEDALRNELARLTAAAAQGNSSQQARARLEARRVLERYQGAHPKLRANLASEFSSVLSTDPQLAALGVSDARANAFSAEAMKDIQRLKDRAADLGMDPGLTPYGSPEFVQEYTYKAQNRVAREENLSILGDLTAEESLSIRDEAIRWQGVMVGANRATRTIMDMAESELELVAKMIKDPSSVENGQARLQDWEAFGKHNVIRQAENIVATIEADWDQIPPRYQTQPQYAQMLAHKNNTVTNVRNLIAGIANNSPSAISMYETQEAILDMQHLQKFPRLAEIGRFGRSVEPLLEFLDGSFGAEGFDVRHEIAGLMNAELPSVIASIYGNSGADQLGTDASVDEIDRAINNTKAINPTRHGHGVMDETGVPVSAIASMDLVDHFYESPSNVRTPEFDGRALGALGSYAQDLIVYPLAQDAGDIAVEKFADLRIVDVIGNAQSGSTTDKNQVIRSVTKFQDLWQERYNGLGDNGRIQDYNQRLSSKVPGAPGITLRDVLEVDFSSVAKNGAVTFRVDSDAIKKLTPKDVSHLLPGLEADLPTVGKSTTALVEAASELSRVVTRDLRAMAHFNYGLEQGEEPNYLDVWMDQSFTNTFVAFPLTENVQEGL